PDPIHGSGTLLDAAGDRAVLPAAAGDDAVLAVPGAGLGRALARRAVATAPARLHVEDVAGPDLDTHLLGLEDPIAPPAGAQHVAVREPVPAAQDPVRRVANAVTRGVGAGRLGDLGDQLEDGADAAPEPAVAARARPELVAPEEEREADLGHLDAAELDAAGRLALARRPPAVARRR